MQWALYDASNAFVTEFSHWVPRAVAHYWGATNVTRDEPGGRVDHDGQRLVPLLDTVPALEPWQRVTGRTIADNGDTATAVYSVADKDLAAYQAERLAEIKPLAEAKILSILPEYKQRNTLAMGLEAAVTYGADPTGWPADLQAAFAEAQTAWAAIKAVRQASNNLEAAISASATVQEVAAVDLSAVT